MLTIHDQIQELRAELHAGAVPSDQRAAAQAELDRLIAAQSQLDRAFNAALEAPPD